MNTDILKKEAEELFPQIVAWRRHFHQHAELSFMEFETTGYIEEVLSGFEGITVSRPTKTGLVARIKGGKPGRTIAIRADIDALPITECNDLPFASENKGVMHACGHDGHTAMLMGVAKIAAGHREELCGELVCIFQHAEELPPGGAVELYRAGVMNGVSELYGCHLSSNYPTGKFGFHAGALTAATDRFDIKIKGKGGHSSMPEFCVDPILTGAQVITAIQNIVSRNLGALEPAVVSVCRIEAGDAYNIIPQEMTITGSVRTFSEAARTKIRERLEETAAGVCSSQGASYEFSYELGYDTVFNDALLINDAEKEVGNWFGPECILPIDPIMPGEDFSALQKECPACFVQVGTRNEAEGADKPHHNPSYRMDEEGLRYGTGLLLAIVASRLGEE